MLRRMRCSENGGQEPGAGRGSAAATVGATVVIEALNPVDFPRYGMHRIEDSARARRPVLAATGARCRVLFDVYNVQRRRAI